MSFVRTYVSDRFKTREMCGKAVLKNGWTLGFVTDCYKNQKMFYKAVDNYPHALGFVPDDYKAQKMWNKVVNTTLSAVQFVPKCYKPNEKCDRAGLILFLINIRLKKCVISLFLFILKYCHDKFKSQKR